MNTAVPHKAFAKVRNELYLRAIRQLAELHKCPGGVLWLRRDDRFAAVAPCRMPLPVNCVEPVDSVFCRKLGEEWVCVFDEQHSQDTRVPVLPAWVPMVPELALVLPLLVEDELIGFIGLQRSLCFDALSSGHAQTLKGAAREAAARLAIVRG